MKIKYLPNIILLVFLTNFSFYSLVSADWPMFQADEKHSASRPADPLRLPLQGMWNFNTQLTAFGFTSAVISNKRVYFGTIAGNVIATDLISGGVLWRFTSQGSVYLTPVVNNNKLFFGSVDGNVYALDVTSGQLLWKFNVGNNINSSPTISSGTLFVGSNSGDVLALDAGSGTLLWKKNLGDYILSSPSLDDNNLYVGLMNNSVVALNRTTGVKIWETKIGNSVRASPSIESGMVYIGSSDGIFRALSSTDGSEVWRFQASGAIVSGAAISSGTVYFGSLDDNLYALDMKSGALLWKYKTTDKIYSSPALINDSVFIGSNDKNLYILDPYSGNLKTSITLGGRIVSATAESLGKIVVITDDGMVNAFKSPNLPPSQSTNLSVNGKLNPFINTTLTTFTWTFQDPDNGDAQTAFQLQVSSNPSGFLSNVIATDTGKVSSTNSSFTLNTLLNEGTYFWRIQTYDQFDDSGPFTDGTSHFLIDRTPPNISIQSPFAGSKFIALRDKIVISYTATDDLDPAPSSSAFLMSTSSTFTISVTSGQVIEPLSIPAGLWTLTVSATDFSGNSTFTQTGTFTVLHDTMPPRTSLFVGVPQFASSGTVYITRNTPLKLSATDDLLVYGDDVGLGVGSMNLSIDSSGYQIVASSSTGANPFSSPVFSLTSATFTVPSLANLDGAQTLSSYSSDIIGNIESTNTITLLEDNTPPVTQVTVSGDQYSQGSVLFISTRTNLVFSSQDPVVNGAASGPRNQVISVDGSSISLGAIISSYTLVSSPLLLTGGTHTVTYFSYDNLGNPELSKSTTVIVDTLPPRTHFNLSGAQYFMNSSTYITSQTGLTLSAVDDLLTLGDTIGSGVKDSRYSIDLSSYGIYTSVFNIPGDGIHSLNFYSRDEVNNFESTQTAALLVDGTPPQSTISISGLEYDTVSIQGTGITYVNADSKVQLSAADPLVNGVASGVKDTNYSLRLFNTSGSITTTTDTPYSQYSPPFGLTEGIRNVSFYSRDNVLNQETTLTKQYLVDATSPTVRQSFVSGTQYISPQGTLYVSGDTGYKFEVQDSSSNGVMSGAKQTDISIDLAPYTVFPGTYGVLGPCVSCANPPFNEGIHTLKYHGEDFAGNMSIDTQVVLNVDRTPPQTQINISGTQYTAIGGNHTPPGTGQLYVNLNTRFTFSAQDLVSNGVASGLKVTEYSVDSGTYVSAIITGNINPTSFTLTEGSHTISYYSIDNVNNMESNHTLTVYVDGTPPKSQISIVGAEFDTGTLNTVGMAPLQQFVPLLPSATYVSYLNGDSQIQISAQDPVVNGVASGVKNIFYAIRSFNYDGSGSLINSSTSPYQIYLTTSFAISEGVRDVLYYNVDNVLNQENVDVKTYRVDATSPTERLSFISGTQYRSDGQNPACCSDTLTYVSGDTSYRFDVWDTTSNNVMSGAKEVDISFDSSTYNVYPGTYALFECQTCVATGSLLGISTFYNLQANFEGPHILRFHAQDYATNVSRDSVTYINVDRTSPVTQINILGVQYTGPQGKLYVNLNTAFSFTAYDPVSNQVASGVKLTKYSIDNNPYQVFTASFTLTEGVHTIQYFSQDNVNNLETIHSITVNVDGTPPITALTVGLPAFTAFGTTYISQYAPLILSAVDPIVNGVASGVNSTNLQIDNLPFQVYSGSFTIFNLVQAASMTAIPIIATGTHVISYFSVDNVQNQELIKQQSVFVTVLPDYALIGTNGLTVTGKSQVAGSAASDGPAQVNGQAQIQGSLTANPVTVVGQSTVTGNISQAPNSINPVPIDLTQISSYVSQNNNNSRIPRTVKGLNPLSQGQLILAGQDSLTLSSGSYYFTGVSVTGGSSVTVTGNVNIFCNGNFNAASYVNFNAGGNRFNLTVFQSTGSFQVAGTSELDGIVYAPYSQISINGTSRGVGSYFGSTSTIDGQSSVLISSNAGVAVSTQTSSGNKGGKAALSFKAQGPDPRFVLGEVYSFPNPAVGGKRPTLHMECGLADVVEFRIYDIAGDLIHQVSITQQPIVINNKYAYEYTWDSGDVASGVYVYIARAKKDEKVLTVMKKLAVVK